MSQAAFCIIGNDVAITMAAEAGQLELNYAEPVLYHKLFESLEVLAGAVQTFVDNCINGITANADRCRELVDGSVGVITAICPRVGYAESASIAKEAIKTGKSVFVLRKMCRNPVYNNTYVFFVTFIHKMHKILRLTKAACYRKISCHLISPASVKGKL